MKAIISVIPLLFASTLFGQLNDADAFFDGSYDKQFILKNSIKQVSVKTSIAANEPSIAFFEFDNNGLLTKHSIFDASGKKVNEFLFSYNRQGDRTERKNIAYDLNKTYVVSYNNIYRDSLLIQQNSSELPFITTYVYNGSGKKVQATFFQIADTSTSGKKVSKYIYDLSGRLTEIKDSFYESSNDAPFIAEKTSYLYDEEGNVKEVFREGKAGYFLSYDIGGLLKIKLTKMPEEFSKINMVANYSYLFSQ